MTIVYAFGYARKSPDDKKNTETSITNQVQLIESFCKKNDYTLIEVYIDNNISGGDRNRKYFSKMIKEAIAFKKDNPDDIVYILVKEQDRFARDSAYFSDTLRDLDIRGIQVFSIIKNNFISYDDLGDVVTSVVDAHYIYSQRKKSKVLFEQKKEQGLPPIKAPFGYINKNKKWVLHRKNSSIVIEVCSDYINNVNYKKTIERLKINRSLYYRIISNIIKGIYNGYVVYLNKIRDSNKVVVRIEEVKYLGSHEPIISEEIFRKVNKDINSN